MLVGDPAELHWFAVVVLLRQLQHGEACVLGSGRKFHEGVHAAAEN
jgi:hypothetical protein